MTLHEAINAARLDIIDKLAAAEAEDAVEAAFAPYVQRFHDDDRSDEVMYRLRISNDARSNARRFRRDAEMLTMLLGVLEQRNG